jgi:hypothetical protein
MARRDAHSPLLQVRVSHEASRLEAHVLAAAFERLLPIPQRRLHPWPERRGAHHARAPGSAGLTRRHQA